MSDKILHQMKDGKIVEGKIRSCIADGLSFCDFDDGKSAKVIKIGSDIYEYMFTDSNKTIKFFDVKSYRKQIS